MTQNDFRQFKHIHIIGVCGTLMGAFAVYLKRLGIKVSGSDQNIYPPMSDGKSNLDDLLLYQRSFSILQLSLLPGLDYWERSGPCYLLFPNISHSGDQYAVLQYRI